MKVQFSNKTLTQYLNQLSSKESVPGGGSAAALTAALGAGLISMVANYSIGRKSNTPAMNKKFNEILKKSEVLRAALVTFHELTDARVAEAMKKIEAIKTGRPPKSAK